MLIPDFAFKMRKKLDPLKTSISQPGVKYKISRSFNAARLTFLTDLFKNNSIANMSFMLRPPEIHEALMGTSKYKIWVNWKETP